MVNRAFLNTQHCDTSGKPVNYASKFLRIYSRQKIRSEQQTPELNENPNQSDIFYVATCNGENIAEADCSSRTNRSRLDQQTKHGVEGFRFSAQTKTAHDGTPQCQLTALRRRVIPGKGGSIRYERTDWGSTLADYTFECTRETAKEFYLAQSLECSTHITIDANLIQGD